MSKIRFKILQKIAQSTQPTNNTTTTPTPTVAGSPGAFNVQTLFPGVSIAFSAKNVPSIQAICDVLNQSIFYSSNGQLDMSRLRTNNFEASTSVSDVLNKLNDFAKSMYMNVFTNQGQQYKQALTPQQVLQIANKLSTDQALQNLPTTNPNGQLNTKINGNTKTLITNYLSNIR